MEYLIGIDYCSYRMPCKTILGDRSYKLTMKRFESKKAMLDVYKEAMDLKLQNSPSSTIFDIDKQEKPSIGLESSVSKLKDALSKVKKGGEDSEKLLTEIKTKASKESKRSIEDIYQEVIIDEINNELIKKV